MKRSNAPTARRKKPDPTAWLPSKPIFRRLLHLRELFRSGKPFTAPQAAAELDVSVRTIYEDLKYAEHLGWKIDFCRKTNSWTCPDGSLPLPVLSLNAEQALALLMAEPALRAHGATASAAALRSALDTVREALDVPLPENPQPIGFELHPVRDTDPNLYQVFSRAARSQRSIRLEYFSADRRAWSTRTLDPYVVYNHAGGWYVAAYCHTRKQVLDFALSSHRMRQIVHTDVRFERDPGWSFKQYAAGGFGIFKGGPPEEVKLLFSPEQALYQQERAPQPGEQRDLRPDGALLVRFTAPINIGLRRWVLQYGSEVQVLAPAALRDQVLEEARRMLAAEPAADPERNPR